jgi:hypothetical protein
VVIGSVGFGRQNRISVEALGKQPGASSLPITLASFREDLFSVIRE